MACVANLANDDILRISDIQIQDYQQSSFPVFLSLI
jgi:hypothetical protein